MNHSREKLMFCKHKIWPGESVPKANPKTREHVLYDAICDARLALEKLDKWAMNPKGTRTEVMDVVFEALPKIRHVMNILYE